MPRMLRGSTPLLRGSMRGIVVAHVDVPVLDPLAVAQARDGVVEL